MTESVLKAPPPPPSLLAPVTIGSKWRVPFMVEKNGPVLPTFRTKFISPGGRCGSVEAVIENVCPGGCHALVRLPGDTILEVETVNLLQCD
jgi:hypothetical protein